MYLNFKLAMETASEISGIRLRVTNGYMHSGLCDSGCQSFLAVDGSAARQETLVLISN
ncbi:hypothetical protein MUK42_02462 [Musa troglodytarum]|uniref:Uncharacterized protein n=1 Tax=Musa troglodytarum TaxID=320322 RepID=A0A9E7ELH3_9LILI|nr:hypothetical protein MUK42_02462 [Musa troglodytarum]URD79659.1 hypothetical protein MUK42_02462 [Musa troglodytarum]URD79660.1 hypothetical protein MUK42_02462 [Musa troglodytarum]